MKDTVSIILAVYNEEAVIENVLSSLVSQINETFELEILVIDGNSTDGTRRIIDNFSKKDARIKFLENPMKTAPTAFNIGIAAATGNYIALFGAHTVYDPDYIAVCLEEIAAFGISACSGRVLSTVRNNSFENQATVFILTTNFGVSGNSFRTMKEGFQDTIPYPIIKKKALVEAGEYDPDLTRNQDNDMNYRLRKLGHRLYLTDKTTCKYFPQETVQKMKNYAFRIGYWNAKSLVISRKSMAIRHFIPMLFVIYLFATTLLLISSIIFTLPSYVPILTATPLLAYLLISLVYTYKFLRQSQDVQALKLPIYYFSLHFSYGLGTLKGLFN